MDDLSYMRKALALGQRGEGRVEPNPMVGCLIVKEDRVVGLGHHRRFGAPHAEVEALRSAGEAARGGTVYVTLEPCNHRGKTPPCTEALIQAGISRVVIGCPDPNKTSRNGAGRLRKAGIEVVMGIAGAEASRLIVPFAKCVTTGLPYVIAKWAATTDGAIASRSGHSRWVSNEACRRIVHQIRARADAVVVGISTVLIDDPVLTARGVPVRRIARRVVVDGHLKLPADCRLLQTLSQAPLTVAVSKEAMQNRNRKVRALKAAGVDVVPLPTKPGGGGLLDLEPLLRHLVKAHQATNVLVEGGGATHGGFLEQNMVDEILLFVGSKVLGDPRAPRPVRLWHADHLRRMDQARTLELLEVKRLGGDVMLRYRV